MLRFLVIAALTLALPACPVWGRSQPNSSPLTPRRLLTDASSVWPVAAAAQEQAQEQKPAPQADNPTGMYSFLREGEVLQLTYDEAKLDGYISRFGDSPDDEGQFIDQFFDKASLQGDRLTFTTQKVHGEWYEFAGQVVIPPGKQPGSEGYRVLKGKLTQHTSDAKGTDKARQREVEFKSFPRMGR